MVTVLQIANKRRVHASLVIGRLQHELEDWRLLRNSIARVRPFVKIRVLTTARNMSLIVAQSPVTLRQTFSFYVSAGKPHIVERASTMADAVVVAGRSGPSVVQRLREKGWDAPVLCDAGSYVLWHGRD